MNNKVLIIDDDPIILEILQFGLARDALQVETAENGAEGLRRFYDFQPDLVILDLMMPGMSGWEVYRTIRTVSEVPFIFFSAMDQSEQVIAGLEFGAADYVTKPFSMPILRARVKAVLRRSKIVEPTVGGPTYDDGYLSVDLDRREVAVRGNSKRLSVKEFELLSCLLENAGRVLTFPQILSTVWGDQHWDSDDYVHVYIWQLRQKLERNPKKPAYILTERGRGYRFAKTAA